MKQNDKGIFLHRIAYSETSLIVSFYTQREGIQKYIFQGGKKRNNALFPLNICELTYYKRTDFELGKLTESSSVFHFNEILGNPIKSTIAFFIADVLKQTLITNQEEGRIFKFLEQKIQFLNNTEFNTLFPLLFLAEFTHYIGISPHLEDNPRYFSLMEGDFHSDLRLGDLSIEGAQCMALFHVFNGDEFPRSMRRELLEIMLKYYELHIPNFNVSKSLEIVTTVLND